ncbi:MAG TPA: 5'-methylthioadenosine/S-adenosylhomocysteine nucleosidase [Gryllotalpicola sp.]
MTPSASAATGTETGAESAAPAEPRAVVVVAMEEEAAPFLARGRQTGEPLAHESGPGLRRDLLIDDRPVTLLRSGIGFANAVAAAAYAYYTFGPAAPVISAGTAGGLARGVRVGDVIVGSRYVNLNADATAFGYALGQVPGMPEDYAAAPGLIARALGAEHGGTEHGDAERSGTVRNDTARNGTVRAAAIGSSEAFVTAARAAALRGGFPDVAAVDMESAALAQFAHTHGQSFLSVRAISDLCAPDGDEFLTHVDDAAERSAEVVVAAIMRL